MGGDLNSLALLACIAVLAWTVRENVILSRIVATLKVQLEAQQKTIDDHEKKFDVLSKIEAAIAVIQAHLGIIQQPQYASSPSTPFWARPAASDFSAFLTPEMQAGLARLAQIGKTPH